MVFYRAKPFYFINTVFGRLAEFINYKVVAPEKIMNHLCFRTMILFFQCCLLGKQKFWRFWNNDYELRALFNLGRMTVACSRVPPLSEKRTTSRHLTWFYILSLDIHYLKRTTSMCLTILDLISWSPELLSSNKHLSATTSGLNKKTRRILLYK